MDGTEEVAGGLVVARGDAARLLELVEELLNQVACLAQMLVIVARRLAAALGRNHDAFARLLQGSDDPLLGIISLVGNDCIGWRAEQ